MRENSTFREGEPYFANACVGNNGEPNYYHYAKGYSSAANLLIKQTLVNNSPFPVDTFVYPICFNMRHSVELRLKGAVENINKIFGAQKKLPPFNLEGSHDIGQIWSYFKKNAITLDERIGLYTTLLDDIITDIAEIDPTGQTFRYPYNIDKEKHLTTASNINIKILSERFDFIELVLDSLESYIEELETEHAWGTQTTRLSRSEILSLALMLPPKETWGAPAFKSSKEVIKQTFNIGSAGFSDAIKIISRTYRTKKSGIPSPALIHLTLNDMNCFLDIWEILHAKAEKTSTYKLQNVAIEKSLIEVALLKEHHDKIALLNTIFDSKKISDLNAIYKSAEQNYPEQYPFLVRHYERQFSEGFSSDAKGTTRELMKVLKKSNFMERLLRFYFLIGHYQSAESLIHRYNLESRFSWIENARREELIADPCKTILANCLEIFGRGYAESEYDNYPGTSRKK